MAMRLYSAALSWSFVISNCVDSSLSLIDESVAETGDISVIFVARSAHQSCIAGSKQLENNLWKFLSACVAALTNTFSFYIMTCGHCIPVLYVSIGLSG